MQSCFCCRRGGIGRLGEADLEIWSSRDILEYPKPSIMRLLQVVLFLGFTIFAVASCQQPNSKVEAGGDSANNHADTVGRATSPAISPLSTPRMALVAQLQLMGQWLKSGDSHQIAQIFSFPVPDGLLTYFGNDTVFNAARARDSDATTAATFQQYFKEISYELGFKEFSRVFQRLQVDRLLHQDSIGYDAIKKKELCYHFYVIQIKDDSLVHITYGVNSRKDYSGPETKDPDFDISLCEHDTFWDFVFDGQHLRFSKNSGAD
jgi:hypothetical protein